MPAPGRDRDVTEYFSDLAEGYAVHRPSYPVEAIETVLAGLPSPVRALDVGCGTGICSRLLAAAGAVVTAIEPNEAMIEEARSHPDDSTPAIDYRVATAEAVPLADDAVDVVICAQSFHWFEADAALGEFHRVLAPPGRLALMWNVRDASDAMARAYEANVKWAQRDAVARGLVLRHQRSHLPGPEGLFENTRVLSFANPHRLDWTSLLGRARSASYFPRSGPLKQRLEARLEHHFTRHARDGVVTLAQRTELTLADPR